MAETDQERLERRTREIREQKAAEAEQKRRQQEEEERRRQEELASDREKAEEVYAYCVRLFADRHMPGATPLQVQKLDGNPFAPRGSAPAGSAPCVALSTMYVGRRPGDRFTELALLAVSVRNGKYERHTVRGPRTFGTLAELQRGLIEDVAGMDADYIAEVAAAAERRGY